MKTGDQGGSPVLANVGHLHDLEHRSASPLLGDKLGDDYCCFGRELAYNIKLVLGNSNTPGCIFKGGLKHS